MPMPVNRKDCKLLPARPHETELIENELTFGRGRRERHARNGDDHHEQHKFIHFCCLHLSVALNIHRTLRTGYLPLHFSHALNKCLTKDPSTTGTLFHQDIQGEHNVSTPFKASKKNS
jgi:hypothetical protein